MLPLGLGGAVGPVRIQVGRRFEDVEVKTTTTGTRAIGEWQPKQRLAFTRQFRSFC